MLIAAVLILGIMLAYVITNYRNRFIYVIAMYFISIAAMMAVAVLYISKLSIYNFPLQIDYNLYLWLSTKSNFHVTEIARLYNFSFAMVMLSAVAFCRNIRSMRWWLVVLLVLPVIYFILVNDSETAWNLYLLANSSDGQSAAFARQMIAANKNISLFIVFFYMLFPVYNLIRYFIQTRIQLKRKYALVSFACLLIINLFVFLVFIEGPFKYIRFDMVNFMKLPQSGAEPYGYISVFILLFLGMLIIVCMTFYFKPFNSFVFISKKEMVQNAKLMNKNMSSVLHIYKNAFLGIERFSELVIEEIGKNPQAALENAEAVRDIADETSSHVQRTLNMLKDINMKYTSVNLADCLNEALAKVCFPQKIHVEKRYVEENTFVYGDKFHLTEMFVNILKNALEALHEKGCNDPVVDILLGREEDFVYAEITDNGTGIDKKHLKSIFKPFYSTKSRLAGSGIGLNYVENVARQHHGDAFVRSEVGKYTCVQIALPAYRKNRRVWFGKHQFSNM